MLEKMLSIGEIYSVDLNLKNMKKGRKIAATVMFDLLSSRYSHPVSVSTVLCIIIERREGRVLFFCCTLFWDYTSSERGGVAWWQWRGSTLLNRKYSTSVSRSPSIVCVSHREQGHNIPILFFQQPER